jgi:uncharacterized protein/ribosomal protein L40E
MDINSVTCQSCLVTNSPTASFCRGCGATLSKERICGKCAVSNVPAAKFCRECGTTLAVREPAELEKELPPVPTPGPYAALSTSGVGNAPLQLLRGTAYQEEDEERSQRWRILIGSAAILILAGAGVGWYYHNENAAPVAPATQDAALLRTTVTATPSFSCTGNLSWSAAQICQHEDLAIGDVKMATLYHLRLSEISKDDERIARLSQRIWIAKREGCAGKPNALDCLRKMLGDRTGELAVASTEGKPSTFLQAYSYDLIELPALAAAWRSILPADAASLEWLYAFQGVGAPISIVRVDGQEYYSGTICKPHDCGDNIVGFLIGVTSRSAIASGYIGGSPVTFGSSTPDQAELLKRIVGH